MAPKTEAELLASLIAIKREKFNEIAAEIDLSKEELDTFKFNSEEDVDAAINSLKLTRSRQNSWKEAFDTKKEGFFIPKVATKAKINEEAAKNANKGGEDKDEENRFNFNQLFGQRFAPSVESMKHNASSEIIRLYQHPNDKMGRLL